MIDAAKEIERISGIPSEETKRIFEEVKANHARLNACAGPHDFQLQPDCRPLRNKYTCSKCGGTIDGIAHSWYLRGVAHGKL